MRLGEILVGRGLATVADIDAALARQQEEGSRLGEILVALGIVTAEQLSSVMNDTPPAPGNVAETGISQRNLVNLMLKFMHLEALETLPELAGGMKLPQSVVQILLDDAIQRRLVQALGAARGSNSAYIRFGLSEIGRAGAVEALEASLYLGPAPVSLVAYREQIQKQRVTNELINLDTLRTAMEGLVVPDPFMRKLLPAINAGRTVLLFGPPGNGKTAIARRIAALFNDLIFIPYAVEIDGQIMKVFDPGLHETAMSDEEAASIAARQGMQFERFDERWAICRRPVAIAGGEFTLDMLDLKHNPETKFYDAPLHVKALNGLFLIDDFGRQQIDPKDFLNRWIVPMENRIDYLKLSTGKSFSLPFDALLMFSTNLEPSDLMDPAFLRRIPYKIRFGAPTTQEYRRVFENTAQAHGLELTDSVFGYLIDCLTIRNQLGLAYYQPKFICDQVVEYSRCLNVRPFLTREGVADALANLYFDLDLDRANEEPLAA